jgi:c-di-GMP phosphodiesterase
MESARSTSVVRRPVFDRALEVVAYEIIVGSEPITEIAVVDSAADESRQLVVNSGINVDLAISTDKPAQLAVSSAILETGISTVLDPGDAMLILGSGVEPSEATTAALENLRALGFRIVLDDLTTYPQLHQLLRLAHGVKINVEKASGPTVAKRIAVLKTAGVELIADGIASYDELREATRLGFTQFQGSFLSRPDGFRKTRTPSRQLAALELISLLQNPDANISDIADVIRRDVGLSYRILKVVNSAHYALPRPLGSIEEAVMLVGTRQIVSWVGMMSMSGLNNKPSELTRTAMVRARSCERLAESLDRPDVQRFYVVGLFSVIEALLDVPARQALGSLPLNSEIVDAIASGGGIMGETLRAVIEYEAGNWDQAHIIGVADQTLSDAFHLAMLETDKAWAQING